MRKTSIRKLLILPVLTVTLTGCATYIAAKAPIYASEIAPSGTIKTAEFGEVIHQQVLFPEASVSLTSSFTKSTLGGLGKYEFEAGDILYQAFSEGMSGNLFCSVKPTYRAPDSTKTRSCLSDDTQDMTFDNVHFINEYSNPYNISSGEVGPAEPLGSHAPYEFVTRENGASQLLGLRISKGFLASPNLNVVAINDDKITQASDLTYKLETPDNLPAIIDILGAKVEFIKIDDNGVKYRVLSGFDTNAAITLVRTTSYIYY